MKRITLIAITAASLSFAASPAFAQSSYGGNTGQSYGNRSNTVSQSDIRRAKKAAEKRAKAEKMKAEAEARLAQNEKAMEKEKMMKDHSSATDAVMMEKNHSSATDAAMMKKEGGMMKEEKMMKATAELPTNCPSGTTAQPNGTCMLN